MKRAGILVSMLAGVAACHAIPPPLSPLLPEVTVDTLVSLTMLAVRDRLCQEEVKGDSHFAYEGYTSCFARLEYVDACDADERDVAQLQALITADERLATSFGSATPVVEWIKTHCGRSIALQPIVRPLTARKCASRLPVLIAHAITVTRDRASDPDWGLCHDSLGKSFVAHNCTVLSRRAVFARRGYEWKQPIPRTFGFEPYLCPDLIR